MRKRYAPRAPLKSKRATAEDAVRPNAIAAATNGSAPAAIMRINQSPTGISDLKKLPSDARGKTSRAFRDHQPFYHRIATCDERELQAAKQAKVPLASAQNTAAAGACDMQIAIEPDDHSLENPFTPSTSRPSSQT